MEWISVKDRLPSDQPCIIYVKEHSPQIYMDYFGECSDGYIGFAHEIIFNTKVTHWIPIPKPPKNE